MLVQQYLPQILDMVEASTTQAICQQVGFCTAAEATKRSAADAAGVLRNNDDTTSAAMQDLLFPGCASVSLLSLLCTLHTNNCSCCPTEMLPTGATAV